MGCCSTCTNFNETGVYSGSASLRIRWQFLWKINHLVQGHTASHKTCNPFTLLVLQGPGHHQVIYKLLKPLKININAVKRQKKNMHFKNLFLKILSSKIKKKQNEWFETNNDKQMNWNKRRICPSLPVQGSMCCLKFQNGQHCKYPSSFYMLLRTV